MSGIQWWFKLFAILLTASSLINFTRNFIHFEIAEFLLAYLNFYGQIIRGIFNSIPEFFKINVPAWYGESVFLTLMTLPLFIRGAMMDDEDVGLTRVGKYLIPTPIFMYVLHSLLWMLISLVIFFMFWIIFLTPSLLLLESINRRLRITKVKLLKRKLDKLPAHHKNYTKTVLKLKKALIDVRLKKDVETLNYTRGTTREIVNVLFASIGFFVINYFALL